MKILTLEYTKLCEAFIYHVFYMYLNKPYDKYNQNYHAEIYDSIDLMFEENNNHIVVRFYSYMSKKSYIAIHQSNKTAIDIERTFQGLDEQTLNFMIIKSESKKGEYYDWIFYDYPITAGIYFKEDDIYSSISWEEFMSNGGGSISILFDSVKERDFPMNLHEYHKEKLDEEWKKQVYDELVLAYSNKTFDIYASCLREHITKNQFKYFNRVVLEELHINVLNSRKRNLFPNS